ncbi:hypothetical protein ON010_g5967 [Phytophthora cinnamomi]|nr:hypothetical protein ON010_g5967 [Phytophthora cinnamomi]
MYKFGTYWSSSVTPFSRADVSTTKPSAHVAPCSGTAKLSKSSTSNNSSSAVLPTGAIQFTGISIGGLRETNSSEQLAHATASARVSAITTKEDTTLVMFVSESPFRRQFFKSALKKKVLPGEQNGVMESQRERKDDQPEAIVTLFVAVAEEGEPAVVFEVAARNTTRYTEDHELTQQKIAAHKYIFGSPSASSDQPDQPTLARGSFSRLPLLDAFEFCNKRRAAACATGLDSNETPAPLFSLSPERKSCNSSLNPRP